MHLYRRGSVWWLQVCRDGVDHRFSTGLGDEAEAKTFARDLERILVQGRRYGMELDPEMPLVELAGLVDAAANEVNWILSGKFRQTSRVTLRLREPHLEAVERPGNWAGNRSGDEHVVLHAVVDHEGSVAAVDFELSVEEARTLYHLLYTHVPPDTVRRASKGVAHPGGRRTGKGSEGVSTHSVVGDEAELACEL